MNCGFSCISSSYLVLCCLVLSNLLNFVMSNLVLSSPVLVPCSHLLRIPDLAFLISSLNSEVFNKRLFGRAV